MAREKLKNEGKWTRKLNSKKKNDLSENVLFRSTLWNYKLVWHFFLILRLRFSYFPPPPTLRIIDFHNHQYFIEQVLNVSPSHNRYAYKSTFFFYPNPPCSISYISNPHHTLNFPLASLCFSFFLSLRVFTAVIWQKKIITEKWVKIMKLWWQFLYVLLFFITFASWSGAVDHLVSGEICIAIRSSFFLEYWNEQQRWNIKIFFVLPND